MPVTVRIIRVLLFAQGAFAIVGGLLFAFIGAFVTPGPEAVAGASWMSLLIAAAGFGIGAAALRLAAKWRARSIGIWRWTVVFELLSVVAAVTPALLDGDRAMIGGMSVPAVALALLAMPSTRQWFGMPEALRNYSR